MSMWSLRWHFTNKSVTGAPCSIKSYSLSHSWTLWWKVRWPKQCRLDVAAELQQRWRRAIVSKLVSPFSVMVWVFLLASLAGKALSGDDSDRAHTVTVGPKVMMSRFVSRRHTQIWNRLRRESLGWTKKFHGETGRQNGMWECEHVCTYQGAWNSWKSHGIWNCSWKYWKSPAILLMLPENFIISNVIIARRAMFSTLCIEKSSGKQDHYDLRSSCPVNVS